MMFQSSLTPLKTPLKKKVRILGIDPGSLVTGYGVIDSDGSHNVHVASGPIRIKAETLPQLFIISGLFMLNIGPFTVSCHA